MNYLTYLNLIAIAFLLTIVNEVMEPWIGNTSFFLDFIIFHIKAPLIVIPIFFIFKAKEDIGENFLFTSFVSLVLLFVLEKPILKTEPVLSLGNNKYVYINTVYAYDRTIDFSIKTESPNSTEFKYIQSKIPMIKSPEKTMALKKLASYNCSRDYKNLRECVEGVKKILNQSNASLDQLLKPETNVVKQ